MRTWTMSWGDSDGAASLLPHSAWGPQPVAPGAARAVRVVIHGFYGVPAELLLVAWDDERASVRLASGRLQWYFDGRQQAYPRGNEIVVENVADRAFPRDRFMDAVVVRSLRDLIETVNAEEVTSIDENGTIHIYGEHDSSRGEVVRAQDSGVILHASGIEGRSPWRFDVMATRLVEGEHRLLEPIDVTPPSL